MRRVARHLFTLCSGIAVRLGLGLILALLVVVLVCWARGTLGDTHDELSYGRAGGRFVWANSTGQYCSIAVVSRCPQDYPFSWRRQVGATSFLGGVSTGDDTRTLFGTPSRGHYDVWVYYSPASASMDRADVAGGSLGPGPPPGGISTGGGNPSGPAAFPGGAP